MSTAFFPIREKPAVAPYKSGDVLVLFGELFSRGYANGLVEEAEKMGMTIVRATVGRREKDGSLRALTAEETANIPKPFINIPLEAGFDMEPASNGQSPIDQMAGIKLSEWENAKTEMKLIEESRVRGAERFRKNTQAFLKELEAHIPAGKNVLFAHLMAGGVPRTKIVMPLMNRAFKGIGERYLSSETFWTSTIGQVCQKSFLEVTAETFRHLLDLSTPLRTKLQAQGSHISYIAYGYHGTDIFYNGKLQWQSYSPYLQGWAKIQLEDIAKEYHQKNVSACVYNCPEILTNSSSIFQGVEVPLYALVTTLQKEMSKHPEAQKIIADCQKLLKDGVSFAQIQKTIDDFYADNIVKQHLSYEKWPQHSSGHQLQKLIESSEHIVSLHKDEKALMTAVLSELVFKSCGYVMLHDSWNPKAATAWIGHDIVARCM
jgi:uncharacterized protein YggL (DUF469 family)